MFLNIYMFEGLSEYVEKKEINNSMIVLTSKEYEFGIIFRDYFVIRYPFVKSQHTIADNYYRAQDELIWTYSC